MAWAAGLMLVSLVPAALAATRYVWRDSPSPGPPYTDWSTAARTIQDAVDAAASTDTVLVTNGLYATGGRAVGTNLLLNRVVIDKPVTVLSVNGPAFTVVEGARAPGRRNGDGAIRCVYLADSAILSGFTLTNGATRGAYGEVEEQAGGGVWCASTNAALTNCIVTSNSAFRLGGGASGCLLYGCALIGNTALIGGAAGNCILDNCTLTRNSANGGGGAYGGTLYHCNVTSNLAGAGGGAYGATLSHCTIEGNSASFDGGGVYGGTLHRCSLNGNSAGYGGGAAEATLHNCTLTGNRAGRGGGACSTTLNHCTLTGNAAEVGGGVAWSTLANCIDYFNVAPEDPDHSCSTIGYSCSSPLPEGPGNIDADPGFVNAAESDFHLLPDSPCIDAGTNLSAIITEDFDGYPRPLDGNGDCMVASDMGAHEFVPGPHSPVIATHPRSMTVFAGTDVSLAVEACGLPEVAYQWRFNGTNIPLATGPALPLGSVTSNASGSYVVVVTNALGSVTSQVATLIVVELANAITNLFDVRKDFSTSSNPNGPWSFGWSQTLNSQFHLHTNKGFFDAHPALFGWWTSLSPQGHALPAVNYNTSDSPIKLGGPFGTDGPVLPPGFLFLHPALEYSVVRWSAPNPGVCVVAATFSSLPDYGQPLSSDGHVLHNGVSLYDTIISGENDTHEYSGAIAVAAGDTIDFAVGYGDDGWFYGDSTQLRATVSLLSPVDTAPVISSHPTGCSLWTGDTLRLAVSAFGSWPLFYQWRFNGTDLVNATSNILTLPNVQEVNEGSYDVVVSNDFGSVTSRVAVLTVIDQRDIPRILSTGLVAYYPFNGNTSDASGNGHNGSISGAVALGTDRFGSTDSALSLSSGVVVVPSAQDLLFSPNAPLTLSFWAYRTGSSGNMHFIGKRPACDGNPFDYQMFLNTESGEGMGFNSYFGNGAFTGLDMLTLTWIHLVGTFDGAVYRFYIDGVLQATHPGTLGPSSTAPLLIGGSGGCSTFIGNMDDVRIYNRALSDTEVKALYDYESRGGLLFSVFALNQLDLQFNGFVSGDDRYHLAGSFVLGQDSDGVDLATEDAVITVGSKKITLPAGTLSHQGSAYRWQGNMDGAQMTVLFEDRGSGAFGFDIQTAGLDLSGVLNPVVVQLLLGNDFGKTTNRLAGELHIPQPPDTRPPQITVAGKPTVLWPPDGKYRRIQVSDFVLSVVDAEDNALSLNDVVITRVTSDEPDDANGSGDGSTVNDIVIGDTGRWVDLRAERQGRGNGRVYAIEVSATDAGGNIGTASFEVQVPHDQGGRSVKDAVAATVTRDIGLVSRIPAGGSPSAIPASTVNPAPALGGELQLDGRGMFMRWQSTEGQAYRVEYKQSLTDPEWVPLGIDILGHGEVLAVRVPTMVYPQRFYRLRAVE